MNAKMDHIAIIVENAETAIAWFAKYLGFTKELMHAPMKANGGTGTRYMIANESGTILELLVYDEPVKTVAGVIQHIGFTVDNVDEFYKVLKQDNQLNENETIKDMGKVKILYFNGIYDIGIELIERKE